VRELILSSGPDRYFGGTIETFALPYGAFIVIAIVLFYIFRHPHSVPRLKYLGPAHQTALGTREPGTVGVIRFGGRVPASAPAAKTDGDATGERYAEAYTAVPAGQPPHASETLPGTSEVIPDPAAAHPADDQAIADQQAKADQQEGDA
jgi:hypothetical protein